MPRPSSIILLTILVVGAVLGKAGKWTSPRRVTSDSTPGIRQYYHSVCGRDTNLMVVWAEALDSVHTLKASRYSGERWAEQETITSGSGNMDVAVCLDADQSPWVVWGVVRRWPGSAYSLWSRRQGDSWTRPRFVTTDTMNWGVGGDVAGDPNQGVWSVWTWIGDYANSHLSVFSSYCTGDTWATPSFLDRCIWYMQPYSTLITSLLAEDQGWCGQAHLPGSASILPLGSGTRGPDPSPFPTARWPGILRFAAIHPAAPG
jgi:hypothetical protein